MENAIKKPVLRFPQFSEQWQAEILGNIATFSKGKGISKSEVSENGKYECVRYGELYTYYNETIINTISKTNIDEGELIFSRYNDVIIPASGETQLDIATAACILKNNIALGGDINIIKTKLNGVFLAYYLKHFKRREIANLSQGVSVVHLYSGQLKTLTLNVPQKEEQDKIANFLIAIDNKILQLSNKKNLLEKYKNGIMGQIFNQKIRFNDDLGNDYPTWVNKKLAEIATFFSGGTPLTTRRHYYDGSIPFIKSGEIKATNTNQFITEQGLKESSAKMVSKGDLLYALYGATSGEVSISKIDGAINQAILCIRTAENNNFLYYYLLLNKENILKTYLQGGQGNLSAEIIKSLKVNLPSINEQNKIADFLKSIDKKITFIENQLEGTKQFKTGLLQQIFI